MDGEQVLKRLNARHEKYEKAAAKKPAKSKPAVVKEKAAKKVVKKKATKQIDNNTK